MLGSIRVRFAYHKPVVKFTRNTFEVLRIRDDHPTPQRQTFPTIPSCNCDPRVYFFPKQMQAVDLVGIVWWLQCSHAWMALLLETIPAFCQNTYHPPPALVGQMNPHSLTVYHLYTLQEFGAYSTLLLRQPESRPEVLLQWVAPQRASTIQRSTLFWMCFYVMMENPFLLYFSSAVMEPCPKADPDNHRVADDEPMDAYLDGLFRNIHRIRVPFLNGLVHFLHEPCETYGLKEKTMLLFTFSMNYSLIYWIIY